MYFSGKFTYVLPLWMDGSLQTYNPTEQRNHSYLNITRDKLKDTKAPLYTKYKAKTDFPLL